MFGVRLGAMGGEHRSPWWRVAAVALAVGAAAATVCILGLSKKDPIEKATFVIAAWTLAAPAARWAWRQARITIPGPEGLAPLADQLALAAEKQWKDAAGERGLRSAPIPVRWRPGRSVAEPSGDAVDSDLFKPLPAAPEAAEVKRRLRAGQVGQLYQVYAGLGSGRLVITGKPGSGKTGAAVLLILAALAHRQSLDEDSERAKVPVPVMFTLYGWDPDSQKVQDWLADRLSQTYPMFEGTRGRETAGSLLDAGKIAVILDGLDEILAGMRHVALRELSQQATTFRLVLLTRRREMADAAEREILQGAAAIELQDIDARTAAAYLKRTQPHPLPPGWRKLISCLPEQPDSPLAKALNTPLMLTLVRATYRPGDNADELLRLRDVTGHPASSTDITDYLLDRVPDLRKVRAAGPVTCWFSRAKALRNC